MPCPICKLEEQDVWVFDGVERLSLICPCCGEFTITRTAAATAGRKGLGPKLSAWIREQSESGIPVPEIDVKMLKELEAKLPTHKVAEKQIRLLRALERRTASPGQAVDVILRFDYPLAWAAGEEELIYLLRSLIERNLARRTDGPSDLNDSFVFKFGITPDGWAFLQSAQPAAQSKSEGFLDQVHNEVNNYFKVHSEDVYAKLQKAGQLIGSSDPEDLSLLLTQVRRAIKSAADYFYPATDALIICADGKERQLGDEQYLNRLQEYLATAFEQSSSRDLLRAELDQLAVFARRLNEVASKGVHSDVSAREAKQGFLGLYTFLYDVILRLQERSS